MVPGGRAAGDLATLKQFQIAGQRNLRSCRVGNNLQIVLAVILLPLARYQRCLGHVLYRSAGPVDGADHGVQFGCRNRSDHRFRTVEIIGAGNHVGDNFKQRMAEADGLGPLFSCFLGVTICEFTRGNAGQGRRERMVDIVP